MAKIANCECGYVARGETDDEVLDDLESHIRHNHPEMVARSTARSSSTSSRKPEPELLDLVEEA